MIERAAGLQTQHPTDHVEALRYFKRFIYIMISTRLHPITVRSCPYQILRALNTTPNFSSKYLPSRPILPDSALHHVFLKGSGPGGQKINKTNSACQITHLPTGMVVKSQATRSKSQNYKIARQILAEKIEFLEKGPESRVAKVREVMGKRKASATKKARRKYRGLELEEGKRDGEGVQSGEREGEGNKIGKGMNEEEKVGVEEGRAG